MIQTRRSSYRGVSGWLVSGTDGRGRRISVFFEHESAARRFADKKRKDPSAECELADFEPGA